MALCFSLLAANASAHRFHHSLAEVEVNSEHQVLEVALKVIPEDLETALQDQVRKRINLEKSENVDSEIVSYLSRTLQFLSPKDKPLRLKWVGKEVAHKAAWLYFEVPYGKLQTIKVKNTLLNGVSHGQQINTMVVSQGDSKQRLVFAAGKNLYTITIQ